MDKDLPRALDEYRTLREVYPDFMPAWNNSGRIMQALGRYDEAAAMYEKAAETAPRNTIPLQNLWYLYYYYKKDVRAAEMTARRFAAMAPELANPHSLLGFSLAVQEKFPEAESELRRALELEPAHPYALPNLAHMLLARGTGRRGRSLLPEGRRARPRGRDGRRPRGQCLRSGRGAGGGREPRTRPPRSRRRPEASVLKDHGPGKPDAGDYICLLGKLCVLSGKTNEARAYLNKALAAKADDPDSLVDLAGLYACLGQVKPAVGALGRAIEKGLRDPRFPVILPDFLTIRKDPEFRALFKLDAPGR